MFPGGSAVLVLCAVLWLLQIYGFEKALRVLDGAHRNRATDFLVLTRAWRPLADIAMMVGIGVFCAARYRCNVEGVTSLVPGRWFDFLLPAALCGVLIAAMHATIHLALIGGDAFVWHLSREARVAHLFAWCLRTAVVIPVFEEFFFRGLLYSWLRRHWTCVPSVLLSSSLFAPCAWLGGNHAPPCSLRSDLCTLLRKDPGSCIPHHCSRDGESIPHAPPGTHDASSRACLPMTRPPYSLKATAAVSCVYAAGMSCALDTCIGHRSSKVYWLSCHEGL